MRALFTAIVVLAAVLLSSALTLRAEELVIISPHWEGIRYEFAEAFKAHHRKVTGKEVSFTWLDIGGTSEIIRYVTSQFKLHPNGIGADLIFGGGIDPFIILKNLNALAQGGIDWSKHPEVAEQVAGIPLHDAEEFYYAPVIAAFGIVCNREVLNRIGVTAPRTWEDLSTPKLAGWIGSADPRISGSMHMAYEIILQAYGWDRGWQVIFGLGRNVRSFVGNSGEITKDVANGETACGLSIDSHVWPLMRDYGPERIQFVVPEGLSVFNGDGIAMLKGAPNSDTARLFMQYLFSEEAQRLWLSDPGTPGGPLKYNLSRLPVIPSLYSTTNNSVVTLNPFLQRSAVRYDFKLGSARWGILNDLLGVFVIDAQELPLNTESPITEQELLKLIADHDHISAVDRARMLRDWEVSRSKEINWGTGKKAVPSVVVLVLISLLLLRRRAKKMESPLA